MSWVKLDDGFFRNAKVIAAGRDARDLYLAALCHCGGSLTDGFVSDRALRMVGAEADVDDPKASAARLMGVGLWTKVDGGFVVHDYHEYQPSATKVRADRDAAAERMRRIRSGGEQPANIPGGSGELPPNNNGSSATRSRPSPVPGKIPVPDPSVGVSPPAPAREEPAAQTDTHTAPPERKSRKEPDRPIPEGWRPSDESVAWAAGRGFDRSRIEHEAERFRVHALAKDRRLARWDQGFRSWLTSDYCAPPGAPAAAPNGRASPADRQQRHNAEFLRLVGARGHDPPLPPDDDGAIETRGVVR